MANAPKSNNIRRTSTLSAAVLTVAALTLTGCGELTALTTPGAISDVRAAGEAETAPSGDAAQVSGTDSESTPSASTEASATAESGTAETAAAAEKPASAEPGTAKSGTAETAAAEKPASAEPGTAEKPATAETAAATPASPAAGAAVIRASSTSAAPALAPATAAQPQVATAAFTSASTVAVQTAATPGSYKPSASNTGVPAGKTLKPYNTSGADLVITKDGTVLDGLDIYGDIKVRAKNVIIKNSRLRGGKGIPRSNTGIVDANSAAVSNLVVQDSTIIPDRASYFRDGIVGHDYKALRNHIQGTNDGLGIFNRPGGPVTANVTAEGNYIHDLTFWSNDPAHSDGTHNDGIQVQGGENIRIVGNNVVATSKPGPGSAPNPRGDKAGAGILLQQNVAKLANVVVSKNWVDGGLSSINIDNGKYSNITVTVSENRVGRNQFDFGNGSKYPVRIIKRSASSTPGLSTNRWADNLALLVEGKTGGIRYNS